MVPQPSLSYGLRSDPGSASTNCSGLSDRPLAIGALAATIFSAASAAGLHPLSAPQFPGRAITRRIPIREKLPAITSSRNECNRTVTLVRVLTTLIFFCSDSNRSGAILNPTKAGVARQKSAVYRFESYPKILILPGDNAQKAREPIWTATSGQPARKFPATVSLRLRPVVRQY